MDKLVSDVGLALYAYLDNSDEKPTPETFHRFLNDGQVIDFLSNHFESKDVTDHREHLGPDAEKKEWSNTGISALQLFVSYNWLGVSSPVTDRLETLLKNAFPNTDKYLELTEENYQKIKSKELLCLAKYCLLSSVDQEEKTTATLIWELRYLSVHQVVLGEPSLNLYKRVKRNVASLNHYIEVPSELRERLLRTQLSAEVSQILLWYKEVGSSRLYLENALSFSGLNIELSGALGVRTKYQEKPTSQLVIQVDRKNDEKFMVENSKRTLIDNPKNAVLDDDTLLNNVKFVNPKGDEQDTMLFPEEEAVVLAVATHKKRAGAFGDELVQDELATFVEYLLSKSSVWAIRFKALLLRSLMEQTRRRKVERAMMQLDHLVCAVRGDEIVEGQNRLDMFYAALPDPSWVIEKHLGDILISMGCFKTALDVFERIQSWKDMITCYHKLDRKHHAEKIIRDQLAKEESPYLWYLLGNATDDVSFYEKSWTESGEKYYKAQTALADYYFDRKEYATCISHYQTSLKLNSLQINSWQRLGYACLHGEDYEGSARAYRRYLEFEQDAYEAWNNLSKAYIKLNNKERAYRTLMEAIKWNYEEWRLWENFCSSLLTSVHLRKP
ncbi:Tetratricopeptide repeat protein 27 [Halotydeus destructor]|nr:Tetratricopeptide repeat protein 27 [Halotydeus destructor]